MAPIIVGNLILFCKLAPFSLNFYYSLADPRIPENYLQITSHFAQNYCLTFWVALTLYDAHFFRAKFFCVWLKECSQKLVCKGFSGRRIGISSPGYETTLKIRKFNMANQNVKITRGTIRNQLLRKPPSTNFYPNEVKLYILIRHIGAAILNFVILRNVL